MERKRCARIFPLLFSLSPQFILGILISLLLYLSLFPSPVSADEVSADAPGGENSAPCYLGVFPFISAQHLESVFAPIAAELDEVMDCSLTYRSASSFRTFMSKLAAGKFDIAYIQPFDYVRIASHHGYIPLVARNEDLHAVLVTGVDSDINSIADLKGRTVSMPPDSAAVSYLGRGMLHQAGLQSSVDVEILYSKDHASCMHRVVIGKSDACVTAPATLRFFERQNDHKFRVIAESRDIPNVLFVVRDDISQEKFHQLQRRLVNIELNDDGKRLFSIKTGDAAFRVITPGEYDVVTGYCKKFRPRHPDAEALECADKELKDVFQ